MFSSTCTKLKLSSSHCTTIKTTLQRLILGIYIEYSKTKSTAELKGYRHRKRYPHTNTHCSINIPCLLWTISTNFLQNILCHFWDATKSLAVCCSIVEWSPVSVSERVKFSSLFHWLCLIHRVLQYSIKGKVHIQHSHFSTSVARKLASFKVKRVK